MPVQVDFDLTKQASIRRAGTAVKTLSSLLSGTTAIVLASAGMAEAATDGAVSSLEVVNFAMVIGAISAAMISAIWLIRERGKIDAENAVLRTSLADANAHVARYHSLVVDRDRRIIIWEGVGLPAEFLGSLPAETGAPQSTADFLAFGRWMDARSATNLQQGIDQLRSSAERFDLVLETIRGHVIEAQGRVSGGRAFVRFVALSNVRAELASLKAQRDRLVASLDIMQTLFDVLEMPVWLRDPDGTLNWVNTAYVRAVEGADRADVLDRKSTRLNSSHITRSRMPSSA